MQSMQKTERKTFSHEWVETIFDEPTCEENGFGTKFCRMCYKKESFDIPAYGHDYIKAIDSQEATCTESGYYHVVCSRCHSESAELIPALGHDFTELTIVKNLPAPLAAMVSTSVSAAAWSKR